MFYRAALFDLDGTLLDTLDDIADAANRVLAAEGFPTHPTDAYKLFVGEGVYKLMTYMLPADRKDPATVERSLAAYRADYGRNWKVKSRPYPGVAKILNGLVERGLRLAVLSNKPDEFTQLCVHDLLPQWRFDAVVGHSAQRPPKPDPAGALEVARRLGVSPGECLYLGDSAVDMKTATAAGMMAVGVLWGFRDRQELEENGARALISRPEELFALLGQFH